MTQNEIDDFTTMLLEADLKKQYQSWEAWSDLITEAIQLDKRHG